MLCLWLLWRWLWLYLRLLLWLLWFWLLCWLALAARWLLLFLVFDEKHLGSSQVCISFLVLLVLLGLFDFLAICFGFGAA